ncbi:Uncharacterised protein [Salmonella enterica subsp. arizonae]|nr:Uncharacterised protein [Salmonella enterica subsp. arizonae]
MKKSISTFIFAGFFCGWSRVGCFNEDSDE